MTTRITEAFYRKQGFSEDDHVENMTAADFHRVMDINFWGTFYPTFAVLPQMLARRRGRIVNIASIS